MVKILTILLVALLFESIGVVYLSKGIKQVGDIKEVSFRNVVGLIKRGGTNPNIVGGIFFEALFFVGLLMLMSKGDVSFVWPLTSLSLVMTTIAARFVLHENVSSLRWTGVVLIMSGAMLITWSEKARKPSTLAPSISTAEAPR
jgi:drug/metabolite transporter (DMT)-like permease